MQNVVGLRRAHRFVPAVLLAVVQLMHPVPALAASPGDLDRSFGVGGVVVTGFTQRSYQDVSGNPTVLADGRIVVAGSAGSGNRQPTDFAVARYTVDGALDTTFGRRGFVHTNFGGSSSNDGLGQALIQPDGKIVAAGRSDAGVYYDFALARYDGNGHLDSSFGSGGKVLVDVSGNGSYDGASAIAIQPDNRIVAVGQVYPGSGHGDFALARFTPDGHLDPTFGDGGIVITDARGDGGPDGAGAVAIQSDGKIVAGGYAGYVFALVRYNPDGSLDPTFGSGGRVINDFGNSGYVGAMTIQQDGKIVAIGPCNASTGGGAYEVARYLPDGSLDDSFGNGGVVVTDPDPSAAAANSTGGVTVQPDGKIIVGGDAWGAIYDFAAVRYTTTGQLDGTFGHHGIVLTDISGGGSYDGGAGVAITPNGRIVLAGITLDGSNTYIAVARYYGGFG